MHSEIIQYEVFGIKNFRPDYHSGLFDISDTDNNVKINI